MRGGHLSRLKERPPYTHVAFIFFSFVIVHEVKEQNWDSLIPFLAVFFLHSIITSFLDIFSELQISEPSLYFHFGS